MYLLSSFLIGEMEKVYLFGIAQTLENSIRSGLVSPTIPASVMFTGKKPNLW